MDLLPNSMSFRFITTITVESEDDIPASYTGRVRTTSSAGLESVSWFDRGELEDPASRIPAVTRYRSTGRVKQIRHYRLGRLHDPSPGEPAVSGFFADGARKYEEHYRYGRRHDSLGKAAITKWRHDGSLRTEWHYYEGLRIEPVRPDSAS